jgi:hypothetical protein
MKTVRKLRRQITKSPLPSRMLKLKSHTNIFFKGLTKKIHAFASVADP